MRVVQQLAPHQPPDEAGVLRFRPQGFEPRVDVEGREPVRAVQDRGERPHHEAQPVGEPAAGDLPLPELDLVEHRLELLAGNPAARDVVEHGEDEGLEPVRALRLAPLDPAGEGRLAGAVVEAGELRRRGAEIGGLERAAKRRPAVVEQDPGEQLGAHGLVRVPRAPEQPAHQVVGAGLGLRLVGGVVVEGLPGLGVAPLVRDRHVDLPPLETPEREALERLLVARGGEVAVGHQHRVGRVVLAVMEVAQHLPGEGRDLGRVAAAVVVVGDGGKEQRLEPLPDLGRGRAHRALHLVVHHALVDQLGAGVARSRPLDPVPLLGEVHAVETGEEGRVQVHRQQVVEVLAVAGGEGVGGPVARGERVHERVEGAADHHEERVADGKAPAPAERGVLEDVGDAGRIAGHGQEGDEERVVVVLGVQVEVARPRRGVDVLLEREVEGPDPRAADGLEERCGHRISRGAPASPAFYPCGPGEAAGLLGTLVSRPRRTGGPGRKRPRKVRARHKRSQGCPA